MDYKITLFLTAIDKLKIIFLLAFYYFPFIFAGLYLNKKKLINKFLILPFSFLAANVFYGILAYFFSFFNLKIGQTFYFVASSLIIFYLIGFYFFIKNFSKKEFFDFLKLSLTKESLIFFVFLATIFISFFSIPSAPAGDAVLHVSRINHILFNGYSFESPFNKDELDLSYPSNVVYFIIPQISFLFKYTSFSVWSFSLVFFLILDFLTLTGFLYWLFKDKCLAILLAFFNFVLFRSGISAMTAVYPNNQISIAFYFLIIFFFQYFKNTKDDKNINPWLLMIPILGAQFIHIAMSALLSVFVVALWLATLILYFFYQNKDKRLIKVFFEKTVKVIPVILISFLPLLVYVFFVVTKGGISTGVLTTVSEKTDPFIIDLYNQYSRFSLKNIDFYFKNIDLGDGKYGFFFNYVYFIQFVSLFVLILLAIALAIPNLLFYGFFSLIVNILIFNFGFFTQKVLPLWLLMRLDQSILVIFLTVFLILYFFFIKVDKNYGYKLFIAFLVFLNFSLIYRIQASRDYARLMNKGYQECEFFWKKVNGYVNLSDNVFVFEGCEEPQYLLNTQTINSRYSKNYFLRKEFINYFSALNNTKKKIAKNKIILSLLKKYVDYLIIRPCENEKFEKLKSIIDFEKVWHQPEAHLNFCVFKIR
jgi:hypothetical protein